MTRSVEIIMADMKRNVYEQLRDGKLVALGYRKRRLVIVPQTIFSQPLVCMDWEKGEIECKDEKYTRVRIVAKN